MNLKKKQKNDSLKKNDEFCYLKKSFSKLNRVYFNALF